MSGELRGELSGEFTGKYTDSGRAGRWLVDRFFTAVGDLVRAARVPAGARVLEAGCGAGYSTQRIRAMLPDATDLLACEIESAHASAAQARNPAVAVTQASIYAAPHPDRSFDLVLLLEVLEHLHDPHACLRELHRISRGRVIVSTPREPLWRALNLCRGKYWRDLGNTPGHVRHWSTRALIGEVSGLFEVEAVRTPVPWTMLLLRPR
ncbi:MAG TPA: class I SAM-dependent methyltransferase [Xanthomonadaceae bacterium]|nr:class I SAM-dependent methyltransferase [Xanthomonadaceae bacterium]